MSKAFTSEETPDLPLVVPPRAALPTGAPNYVTPRGLRLLRAELADLEARRAEAFAAAARDDPEERRRLDVLTGRLVDLAERIRSAQLVGPQPQPREEVRFGATVTLRTVGGDRTGEERRFTIVGVDEADPADGRIAFVAPLARAILGCRCGDVASLRTTTGEEELEVVSLEYADDRV